LLDHPLLAVWAGRASRRAGAGSALATGAAATGAATTGAATTGAGATGTGAAAAGARRGGGGDGAGGPPKKFSKKFPPLDGCAEAAAGAAGSRVVSAPQPVPVAADADRVAACG
jgi:hypothetical protein